MDPKINKHLLKSLPKYRPQFLTVFGPILGYKIACKNLGPTRAWALFWSQAAQKHPKIASRWPKINQDRPRWAKIGQDAPKMDQNS